VNVGLSLRLGAFILTCVTCFTTSAFAVDGVVLIDQARALAGNLTPGDAPGFPVTISLPGSYRLSGNLTVPADTHGIEIAADHVTLDLNGFQIAGTSGQRDGVRTGVGGLRGLAVRNGSVTNFNDGISLGAAFGSEITQIRATDNTANGISTGPHSTVTGNIATRNGRGIGVGAGSLASGNHVFENETIGMEIFANSTALNNIAGRHFNGPGIRVFCPVNVIGNTSLFNGVNLEVAGEGGCTFANNNMPIP
jgi:hypothetical protein